MPPEIKCISKTKQIYLKNRHAYVGMDDGRKKMAKITIQESYEIVKKSKKNSSYKILKNCLENKTSSKIVQNRKKS